MGMFDEKKKKNVKKENVGDKFITITRELGKGDNVKVIGKHMKNNGSIKFSSKKEKTLLKAICPHHSLNHKGSVRSRVTNDGEGHCQCTICQQTFRTELYTNDELKQIRSVVNELCNQTKYIAVSADAGENILATATLAQYFVTKLTKDAKKLRNYAQKQENVHKKKKGNNRGNRSNGSWAPKNGSWN